MEGENKSNRLLNIKTRAAQGDVQFEDLILVSFFPFKIKAIKDKILKKIRKMSFPGCVHRSPGGICSGVEFQRGWRDKKADYITSQCCSSPLTKFLGRPYAPDGKRRKTKKQGRHFVMEKTLKSYSSSAGS